MANLPWPFTKIEPVKDELVKDEVILEADDSVFQAETLLNFAAEPPSRESNSVNVVTPAVTVVADTDVKGNHIGELIRKIENEIVTGKNKEIEKLKCSLKLEKRRRKTAEEKVEKLVEFISFLHGQFGTLIKSLVSLTNKSVTGENTLIVGPFHDDSETNEFLGMLKDLSTQFQNQIKNLGNTKNLLERANLILAAKPIEEGARSVPISSEENYAQVPTSSSTSIELDPYLCDLIGLIPSGTSVRPVPPAQGLKRKLIDGNLGARSKPKNFIGQRHGVDYSKRHWGCVCLCGSKYATKSNLNFHIKYFTTEWKFECEICKKRFIHASILRRHASQVHNIVDLVGAPLTCSVCGQEFQIRRDLLEHHRIGVHRNAISNVSVAEVSIANPPRERVEIPPESAQDQTIERHGEDPKFANRCLCGKVYKYKHTLAEHISSRPQGIFQCSLCSQSFDRSWDLRQHCEHVHKNDFKNFDCGDCGISFPTQRSLVIHRSIAHQNQWNRQNHNVTVTPVATSAIRSSSSGSLANDFRLDKRATTTLLPFNSLRTTSLELTGVEDEDGVICID